MARNRYPFKPQCPSLGRNPIIQWPQLIGPTTKKKNPRPKMDQSDSLSQEYAIYKRNTAIGGETASLQCPGEKVLEVLAEISGYGSLKWDC